MLAILVQAALAAVLVVLGTFDTIVAYFVFVTVAFLALTVAGLYRLPRPSPATGPRLAADAARVPGDAARDARAAGRGQPAPGGARRAVVAAGVPVYRLFVAPAGTPARVAPLEEA